MDPASSRWLDGMARDTLWISELEMDMCMPYGILRRIHVKFTISVSAGQEITVTATDDEGCAIDGARFTNLSLQLQKRLAKYLKSLGGDRFGYHGVKLLFGVLKRSLPRLKLE